MKKLYRCRWDKKIGGVCGGLGQYFGCDPTFIRLLLVFLCILTACAPFAIVYTILWIMLPLGPSTYVEIPCKKLYRSKRDRKIAGVCGGFAPYFNIDPTILRVIFVILAFTTFVAPAFFSYLIGMLIIPEDPSL
jgi:phage shock protein C